MNNYVQTFSGFQIPPGHIIKFLCVDTGQNGIFSFGITYLQNDKIKNFFQSIDASEYATDSFELDVDLYDSKVLSIDCVITGQRNVNVNRRVNVFLVNSQGRGAETYVGLITQQDVSQFHPLAWPFNGNVNNFTPYGVPTSRLMVVDGNTATFTVPGNWIFRLGGLSIRLITDATVADRTPYVKITENAIAIFESADPAKQLASKNVKYSYARHAKDTENSLINTANYGIPDFVVHGGTTFEFIVDNFQAGDSIPGGNIYGEYIYNG